MDLDKQDAMIDDLTDLQAKIGDLRKELGGRIAELHEDLEELSSKYDIPDSVLVEVSTLITRAAQQVPLGEVSWKLGVLDDLIVELEKDNDVA